MRPQSDNLQLCESLLFQKSSIIPIAENFLTRSTFPFFLSVAVRLILPTLCAGIIGRAFFCLLGGRDLLNAVIVSIYFNYIAVEGLIPRAKGSVEKSTTLGQSNPLWFLFITVLALLSQSFMSISNASLIQSSNAQGSFALDIFLTMGEKAVFLSYTTYG